MNNPDAAGLRKRAEEQAARSQDSSEPLTLEAARLKLHELRVHQIELEMQNEELRRVQAELDSSRVRYFERYDLAPVGYVTVSEAGLILESNLTLATLLGMTRNTLVNRPFSRFILKEDADSFFLLRKRLLETGEPQACDLRMVKGDGTRFWAHLAALKAVAADGVTECRITLTDSTERILADASLRESNQRYDTFVNALPDMAFLKNECGRYIIANKALLAFFGKRKDEVIGKTDFELMPKDNAQACWESDQTALQSDDIARSAERVNRRDYETWKFRVRLASGQWGAAGFIRDVTERKLAAAYREMGLEVLRILNEPGDLKSILGRVLDAVKNRTGADAVGLRLQDGEDFPYFAQEGFSKDFLLTENTLAERGADGGVCRDRAGKVCLECTCGLVISGKTDPAHPLFTHGGSFWTNDSAPLLDLPPEQDPRYNPRNECIHLGYASVALIPIRDKERIVGLLHLNDRRKGCFTLATVRILEDLAAHIGAALMRKRSEEALLASQERFRLAVVHSPFPILLHAEDGTILQASDSWCEITGYTHEELATIGDWTEHAYGERKELVLADIDALYGLGDRKYEGDFTIRTKSGVERIWDFSSAPLGPLPDGRRTVISMAMDVTERRQDEVRLARQLDELRRWQNIMLDREDRVRELKREVNGFCLRAGEAARYPSQEDAAAEPERAQAEAEEPVASVEGELRQSLDHAERSRLAMLSAMEDQQRKSVACVLNAQRVESLLRLNRMIGATPQELMDYALEESVRLTRSEIGYLAFLNEDESVLTMNSWSRSAMAECAMADKPIRFPIAGTGLWGEAVRQRRAVITNDYAAANPLKKGCPQGHVPVRRHMNVPVFDGSRIVIVAGVGNKDGAYDLDDVQELTLLMDGLWRLLEHRRADEALKREQSLSKAIIDSIPGAFYVIDEYGRYVRWNAYLRDELVGKPEDQVAGANAADTIHPDDRTLIQSGIENVLLNGAVETMEGRVLLRGGPDFRWLLMTGRRMLIDGHPFLVGIGIDINAHKRDKAELQKLDKLQSVGILAGGIAHDFNNILLGLFGNISIAMDDLPKEHPSYAPLEEAEKSMSRAVRLTKQLLTFAKGGTPVKEHVSLGDLVEEVARFDLTGSSVILVYHAAEDLWPIDADKGQIQQVISNLVINARQAMPNGGHLTLTLENADLPNAPAPNLRPGRYVRVTVQDEGCGIGPKVVGQIFDPYFTTKQSSNGLGLATVWSIINKHGGHIGVESEFYKGTTFTLYLPASAAPQPAEAKPSAAECLPPTHTAKILVMDDEKTICELVACMLRPCGHVVVTATGGQATVALYGQALETGEPFDAVIMDLTIPGEPGGKEVIKDLLALDPHVRAIVSSGYADDPVMANPAAYGFKGTVAKPYTACALREVVTRVLT